MPTLPEPAWGTGRAVRALAVVVSLGLASIPWLGRDRIAGSVEWAVAFGVLYAVALSSLRAIVRRRSGRELDLRTRSPGTAPVVGLWGVQLTALAAIPTAIYAVTGWASSLLGLFLGTTLTVAPLFWEGGETPWIALYVRLFRVVAVGLALFPVAVEGIVRTGLGVP